MEKEPLLQFQGKTVKIILRSNKKNFALTGIVDHIFDTCLQFTTSQRTSIIDFDQIMEVTLVKKDTGVQSGCDIPVTYHNDDKVIP